MMYSRINENRETFFFFNFSFLKEEREIIRTTTSKYIEAKKMFYFEYVYLQSN